MPSDDTLPKFGKSEGEKNDELENQIGAGHTHGSGNAGADICDTARGSTSRCTVGGIPYDRRDLVNLRLAFREAEIGRESMAFWKGLLLSWHP